MSTCAVPVAPKLTSLACPGKRHMNWGCGLVVRVGLASQECRRQQRFWNLARTEMEPSVSHQIRFNAALGGGEIDNAVEQIEGHICIYDCELSD